MQNMNYTDFVNFFGEGKENNLSDYYVKESNGEISLKKKTAFQKSFLGRFLRHLFGIHKEFSHYAFENTSYAILNYIKLNKDKLSPEKIDQIGNQLRAMKVLQKHSKIQNYIHTFFENINKFSEKSEPSTHEQLNKILQEEEEFIKREITKAQQETRKTYAVQLEESLKKDEIGQSSLNQKLRELYNSPCLNPELSNKLVQELYSIASIQKALVEKDQQKESEGCSVISSISSDIEAFRKKIDNQIREIEHFKLHPTKQELFAEKVNSAVDCCMRSEKMIVYLNTVLKEYREVVRNNYQNYLQEQLSKKILTPQEYDQKIAEFNQNPLFSDKLIESLVTKVNSVPFQDLTQKLTIGQMDEQFDKNLENSYSHLNAIDKEIAKITTDLNGFAQTFAAAKESRQQDLKLLENKIGCTSQIINDFFSTVHPQIKNEIKKNLEAKLAEKKISMQAYDKKIKKFESNPDLNDKMKEELLAELHQVELHLKQKGSSLKNLSLEDFNRAVQDAFTKTEKVYKKFMDLKAKVLNLYYLNNFLV